MSARAIAIHGNEKSGERTWKKRASAQLWLYIILKLFSRTRFADDKILILLKGHSTIYKKQLRDSTAEWYGFNLSMLKCRKIISSVMLKSSAKTSVRKTVPYPRPSSLFNITQLSICSVRLNNTAKSSVANFLAAYISSTEQVLPRNMDFLSELYIFIKSFVFYHGSTCLCLWMGSKRKFFDISTLTSWIHITQLYCRATVFCKLWSDPLKMLKFYYQRLLSLKRAFD